MSNVDSRARAMGDEDWAVLRDEVLELFTPGSPVDEAALFAGPPVNQHQNSQFLDGAREGTLSQPGPEAQRHRNKSGTNVP